MARLGAFRSRDFRLLVAGQLISLTGTQMQRVAIAWQLYLLTHSPLSLGLLGLFRVVPVVTLALGGGVIADAVDRRRLMLASQVALALTSLVLALSTRAGITTPLTIYAVTVAAAAAVAFESPARQALLPLLVPRQELSSALSLHAMAWQIAMILGPALGGVLIAWRRVGLVYFVDAAAF